MMRRIDLEAHRHASWGSTSENEHITFLGEDLSEATFAWAFADKPGGNVTFTLGDAPPGTEGLHAVYLADYLHPVSGSPVGATLLIPQIDAETLKGLADPAPPHTPITLTHTLYVTRMGGPKLAQFSGNFTIQQGAPN